MSRAGCRWVSHCLAILGLVLFLLTGCSSGGGDGDGFEVASSRVTLQMDFADPPLDTAAAALRTAAAPQVRQTELISLIEIVVTGDGIDPAIVVTCPLDGTSTSECVVTEEADRIVIDVVLTVPTGDNRTITVTALASSGEPIYRGATTVTLTEAEEVVTLLLNLVTTSVRPEDLANRTFVFTDGTAFGFPDAEVTLQFLSFSDNTGFFILQSGDPAQSDSFFIASGEITLGSCFLLVLESTFPPGEGPQVNDELVLDPCEVDFEGRLRVTSVEFVSMSVSNPPSVNLFVTGPTVIEGDSGTVNARFDVTLGTTSRQPVSVDFATADGTALAGSDYQATSGTLAFDPGDIAQTVNVLVNGDTVDEFDEAFLLVFSNPVNAAIFPVPVVTGTIQDDDDPPTLSISDATVMEGNEGTVNALFDVTLSAPSGLPVSVDFVTADGSAVAGTDYQSTSGSLGFAPGVTDQTITVQVNGDVLDEANETFLVNLSNAVNATIADGQGIGTVTDDDSPPGLMINDVTVVEGDSGTTDMVFMVTLTAASSLQVTVDFATANGSAIEGVDYQGPSGTLTFAPGMTSQMITVPAVGDVLDEADETFLVNLSNAVNATIADGQGVGTIQDNDSSPTLSIIDVTVAEGDSGTTNALVGVTLLAPSSLPVTIDFATADGSAVAGTDYQATSGTLSFAPGTTSQTITVQVNGDVLDESDETFLVNFSNPVNALLPATQALGTIQDNDPPPTLSISDMTVTEGDAGVTNAVYTVSLAAVSGLTVMVDFATADGSATLSDNDYVDIPTGTLSFAPGTTSQTITVQVNGDANDEADETFLVNLSNAVNATILDGQGVGTIQNDDAGLSINDVTVTEGDTGTTNAVFTVSLAAASSLTVTVDFATADGSATLLDNDYVDIPTGTLSFAPGTTSQTITVQVNGDTNLNEAPDETFFVDLSNPVNAALTTMQGMGTIVNDDFVLYSVSPDDNCLREINPADASITNSITITIPGGLAGNFVLDGANGLATDLQTGELWALLTLVDNSIEAVVEELVVINPTTGEATSATSPPSMGNISDQFAALAFDDAGTRYGLTDSFAITPITLFMDILDPSSALCSVPTDFGAHALAYNSVDGLLYHATGGDGSTNNLFFESFTDPITVGGACITTTSGSTTITDPAGALTHSPFANEFFLAAGFFPSDSLYRLTPAGVATPIGLLGGGNVRSKGLAFNGFGIGNDFCHFALSVDNVSVAEGNTGTTNATFTVTLSAASSRTVTVEFATADDTATVADNDYVAIPAGTLTLTFAPGTISQTATVQVTGDGTPETFETFLVNLSNPTNATIANGQGVGTIRNDD